MSNCDEGSRSKRIPLLSLTLDQVNDFKFGLFCGGAYSSRVSLGLALRLSMTQCASYRDSVVFEIEALESGTATSTKPAQRFRKGSVSSFWHKHFYVPENFLRNIGDRWGVSEGAGNEDLSRLIDEVAAECGSDPDLWPKRLAHRLVIGGLEERAASRRLTGHWIIFGQYDDRNYYLDIATHEEGLESDRLYDKLKASAEAEFSFLFRD